MSKVTAHDWPTGVICDGGMNEHGYFGWPTVARQGNGTLWVAASGLRQRHVCPWGKTVVLKSQDGGQTWSSPRVLNDTPLDDRDCGLVSLGGSALLITWFSVDIRQFFIEERPEAYGYGEAWAHAMAGVDGTTRARWERSWIRVSEDGSSWSDFIAVPVTAPHGPVRLRHCFAERALLYLGKTFPGDDDMGGNAAGMIRAAASLDGGRTWRGRGIVPVGDAEHHQHLVEPHVAELPSGKLVGLIRGFFPDDPDHEFHLYQTESLDGGVTWTPARFSGIYGSPPHLLVHSSGALVCTYGYRIEPYGIRARVSHDEGASWGNEIILRDDGPTADLGYPSTVELDNGELFTAHYQQMAADRKCGLLWTRWTIPDSTESAAGRRANPGDGEVSQRAWRL